MGTVQEQELPVTDLLEDLKVTLHESCFIYPSKLESNRKTMFLSNVDQVLNFDVETVHFFRANKDFPPHVVVEKLKKALADVLVAYEFLAGRMKENTSTGRLEIDCNAKGVGFVVASSEYTLNELADLVYPNPAFAQLVHKNADFLIPGDHPLCVFQFTSFKCGGFAMGLSNSHSTFDGSSVKVFLDNLAALAAGKPLVMVPCNDRELLMARTPPRISFPHHELIKVDDLPSGLASNLTVFEASSEDLSFKIFKLDSDMISRLKKEAKAGDANARVSGFIAVTAHIWRCKALSAAAEDPDRVSTLLYAVDIKPRLNPPLPASYAGNAVLTAYVEAKCRDLEEGPLSKLVGMVSEGAKRITDEYVRSAMDWGELHKGFPNGEVLVSSWWRLGLADVEYPWGKPTYSCPVVCHRKDIILLLPDIQEGTELGGEVGANVLAALPPKEMQKFETLFYKLMP